jgi:D-apiose dehydrogenase
MSRLRGVAAGAGYFSQFHYDAWRRLGQADLVALCDVNEERARATAQRFSIPRVYRDVARMLEAEQPDFIDVITPPDTHAAICRLAGARGVHVLCQKALAPTFEEGRAIVANAEAAGIRLMVHDNFRFQPWHREVRRLLDGHVIGRLHSIACRTRLGDGWGPDAYLGRQPYFRTMPKLLIFETGVHFIDVFRYLAGEVQRVYARLRRLNAMIAGEDCGLVVLEFESGVTAVWDANRYNESLSTDTRYTFGEFLLEGDGGSLRLSEDGRLLLHPLGEQPREHDYPHTREGFAGDCCHAAMAHFIDCLIDGTPFETAGPAYLRTLAVQEAVYQSAATGQVVAVEAVAG